MEQLQSFVKMLQADEAQTRQVLLQLDDFAKQNKDLQPYIQGELNALALSAAPSPKQQEQHATLEAYRAHFAKNTQPAAQTLLLLLTALKQQLKLTETQKQALLCFCYIFHSNTALHKLALQMLLRQFQASDYANSALILLQYFALAAQQQSPLLLQIFNAVMFHFTASGNFYAANEFLRRARAKLGAQLRGAGEGELQQYHQ